MPNIVDTDSENVGTVIRDQARQGFVGGRFDVVPPDPVDPPTTAVAIRLTYDPKPED